ncbi:MAG: U32 family peptidase [Clostridia bacterium]|nr:U32 family peptidase [Clostridia bacterium]
MSRPELLAPAGSLDALRAAVCAGADAVYMAGAAFNARRNAKNFTEDELREAISWCKEMGVRTHITVNILLTDDELPDMLSYAEKLAAYGADALIVADVGVARLLHAHLPDMELHASTQLTLCNAEGVDAAAGLGFTRAVLARELSGADIREIAASTGIETEVFAHGALCMCYSGQCYMSALIGRRSGNRGLCAQPCRLPYTLAGRSGYPLSLRDLNLSDSLSELADAGVASLKLEGRMKSPDYVHAVTSVYAACLEERRTPTDEEQQLLYDAFSRDGFTKGYFEDRRGAHMFGVRADDAPKAPEFSFREGHIPRRVRVTMTLSGGIGDALSLTVSDGIHARTAYASPLTAANRPTDPARITDALSQTGGTPYMPDIRLHHDPAAHIPLSEVKALRREALAALSEARRKPREVRALPLPPAREVHAPEEARFVVFAEDISQITPEVLALRPLHIALPLEVAAKARLNLPCPMAAVMPTVARPGEMAEVYRLACLAKEAGAEFAYISNLGMIRPAADAGLIPLGDTGLNIFNSPATEVYADLSFASLTASFELPLAAIRRLRSPLPLEAVVYGHLPAMICENCIVKNASACGTCGSARLTDRTGAEFPVLRAFGCRSRILNAHTLWLPDRTDELIRAGISRLRLAFTCESPDEVSQIAVAYARGSGDAPGEFTRGLYFRPLE